MKIRKFSKVKRDTKTKKSQNLTIIGVTICEVIRIWRETTTLLPFFCHTYEKNWIYTGTSVTKWISVDYCLSTDDPINK